MRYANTDAVPIFDGKPDVVEVVRCKDCKLRDTEGCPITYWNGGELESDVEDFGFCSYGERIEE